MVRYLLQRLSGSFWFLPSLMTLSAVALAFIMGWLDGAAWADDVRLWSKQLSLGADGSRQVVSTIAGAMITAASLVYSMTLVALTLAAQSAGQRLLQELMGNRPMQISLGLFLSTFVYCLLILRTIVGDDDVPVPNLSVAMSILLAITSFVWLIYFIHSLASAIQTHSIVAVVARQLGEALQRQAADRERAAVPPLRAPAGTGTPVCIDRTGYLETVDEARLLAAAVKAGGHVRMAARQGYFLATGDPIAERWGGPGDAIDKAVLQSVVIGPRRTPAGDPEYLVHLLSEIALRALSPGINDTYTAIACLDHLFGAFAPFLGRGLQGPARVAKDGHVRLEVYPVTLSDLLQAAANPIREAAAANLPVALRLLDVLERMAARAGEEDMRAMIRQQAELAAAMASRHAETDHDRDAVSERLAKVTASLERPRGALPRAASRK